jgi:hypothetical protein
MSLFILTNLNLSGQIKEWQFMDGGVPGTDGFVRSFTSLPPAFADYTLEIGHGFNLKKERAIFFGGNIGYTQNQTQFGHALGKWSLMGEWQLSSSIGFPGPSQPGINYLCTYHRWDNYMALYGLVERRTLDPFGEGGTPNDEVKDAVIAWAYEKNELPNRLIFKSVYGAHHEYPLGSGMHSSHLETELMTMLHNGNLGIGTSAPSGAIRNCS